MERHTVRLARWASVILLILLGALTFAGAGAQRPAWQDKVAPDVLRQSARQNETEFIVFLEEQAELAAADALRDKTAKGRFVIRQLQSTARRTQAPLLAHLRQESADYRAYWIANMIWVRGDRRLLQILASRPDVAAIYENAQRVVDLPAPRDEPQNLAPAAVEWNVAYVNAPEVWALGANGQGVVIGGQDTGYDWQHPALRAQYRGWNGTSADHNYNWHDAIHSGGGSCGADSPEPCDAHGHGTHTMGTMIGDDGGTNQIGVAPGATWIGCRNMDEFGVGSPATYSECFQWFVAPTDGDGENPDPARAPHVINNSWACTVGEGCDDGEIAIMEAVVENVRAAGIVVVASAGNAGPSCGTVQYPPALYDASLSIGATGFMSDVIAPFSSRGPVAVDGSNRLKPDVVAPGVGIRSARPGGTYGSSSGTSMAAPHVAGLVALLISADPGLAGDVDAIEGAIVDSAVPLTTNENCGGIPGDAIPNNTYGYGRIDALEAYLQVAPLTVRRHFPFITHDLIQE